MCCLIPTSTASSQSDHVFYLLQSRELNQLLLGSTLLGVNHEETSAVWYLIHFLLITEWLGR